MATRTTNSHIVSSLLPLAVAVDSLAEDPKNARRHDQRNLEAIKMSLERFGQQKPIVVQDGVVVAGNGTLAAARALGWETIAVTDTDLEGAAVKAYALADNRTAELASWDDIQLAETLDGLRLEDADLAVAAGWSLDEADRLVPNDLADVDVDIPEVQEEIHSERGEVYELGPHRLMCGDSTSAEDVAALLGGATPNLMVTDPPYGVSYDAIWRADAGLNARTGPRVGTVTNDDRADWSEAWALFPGAVAYVWHDATAQEVQESLKAKGFETRSQIVWAKTRFAIGRGHYHWQHEPCWYAVRKGKTAAWAGDRSQTTLWAIPLDANVEGGHSTQKPLECMERPIRNHEGDVYDPFLGSGTTLIAAARQGRRCYGLEISPAYCDVIRRRWTRWAAAADQEVGSGGLE